MAEENLEYDIGADEEETTVSMNDDGSEAEVEQKAEAEVETEAEAPAEAKEATDSKENELDQYSDSVQKRINKLTARLREHQRREQAALDYAKSLHERTTELEKRFKDTDSQRMSEAKNRIETQTVALKQIIKKAREEGDIDTETEAQQRLTNILWEQQNLAQAEKQAKEQAELAEQQPQQYQQQYQQPVQSQPQVDPRAEEWAEQNSWFGTDTVMTHAAMGIHKDLVLKEKFDANSEQYYDELDKRLRDLFPSKFGVSDNRATTKPVQTVASATRSSGVTNTARRSVRLSPSQVAIAKKLGVPLEEYAKYVKE